MYKIDSSFFFALEVTCTIRNPSWTLSTTFAAYQDSLACRAVALLDNMKQLEQ
jgi:hypothetical protein